MAKAPRCLAKTRKGTACQSPAVKGSKRCRMHGGKGSGAPKGNSNALMHGARSANAREVLDLIRRLGLPD
ncbi:HGGxSTG domain-containing protein [Erythrobacter longus]|uniref:HGGxSTG domain-containing protein n=1 Tax=Erythrobacter longus TaxID=1044 RepID=UPI003BAD0AC7